jgi:hypothetical protein
MKKRFYIKKFESYKENKNTMAELKKNYVDNAMTENNMFIRDLLAFEAEFIHIDSDTFFSPFTARSNIFFRNLKNLDGNKCRRFYKMLSIYYTISLSAKKRGKINIKELKDALFRVFDFEETEKLLFQLLFKCRMENKEQFWPLFSKAFIGHTLGIIKPSLFAVAFTENFCYNSFRTFMRYYTKYISFNRRIEISKAQ